MLVTMMYGLPGLQWESPTGHAELFSGCMSVTIGELEVCIYTKKTSQSLQEFNPGKNAKPPSPLF